MSIADIYYALLGNFRWFLYLYTNLCIMKNKFLPLMLCLLPVAVMANGPSLAQLEHADHGIPKLSLSVNPAGFLFFGPTVDLAFGINSQTGLNVHARFTPLGMLSQVVKIEDDEKPDGYTGVGFGAGAFHFLQQAGEGFYVGAQVEYEKMRTTYDKGEDWEWFEEGKNYVLVLNGGFRKNFNHGIYVNAGAFFGGIYTDYFWEYDDKAYGLNDDEEREGTTFFPVGSLELAIGIAILK